jgi:aryl carrier-like protein
VPIGVAGELHIGGVQVGRGYLGRPELTAERFIPDPFALPGARLYKTGDLSRFLPDGSVEYLGRMDHQVKIRGFRIELGEIEAVMLEHPAVHESVVVVREDRKGDPRLVGYYVAGPDAADPEPGLRARLQSKLPEHMVPSALVRLEALPRLSSGKVSRRDLPMPDPEHRASGTAYAAPLNATEEALSQIWASILGRTRVGAEDNFFDLGGNSILMIQVIAQARRRGLQLTPLTMFRFPTVRSLAVHLAGGAADAPRYEGVQDRARRQREARARHSTHFRGGEA